MGYERVEGGWNVWCDGVLIGRVWRVGHNPRWLAADVKGNDRGVYRTRAEAAEGLRKEQG